MVVDDHEIEIANFIEVGGGNAVGIVTNGDRLKGEGELRSSLRPPDIARRNNGVRPAASP